MNTKYAENRLSLKLITLLAIVLMLSFCMVFTGCGSDDELTDDDIDYIMNEGAEDAPEADPKQVAKAKALNQDTNNFIGKWKATSDEAKNLYGSLEISINEDGTFDADVTGESFSGTWTKVDNGISYTSELMKGKIYYGDYGKLVIEDNENGDIRVVLNKVN